MSLERSGQTNGKKLLRNWTAATLLSAAAATGGAYGWVRQSGDPQNQDCVASTVTAYNLRQALVSSGTIVREYQTTLDVAGSIQTDKIVNQNDPKLKDLERAQSVRDEVCLIAQQQDTPYRFLERATAILGSLIAVAGFQQIRLIRREHMPVKPKSIEPS